MNAFDDRVAAWRSNPDADATIALCAELSVSGSEQLAAEVGAAAEQWHGADVEVMLAVGRMHLAVGLVVDAQRTLVTAGKLAPSDPRPFRFLGEALLRRGDAIRAQKVLQRAIEMGADDADAHLWHDRASVYVPMQEGRGTHAVAIEVARSIPSTPPTADRPTGEGLPPSRRPPLPPAVPSATPGVASAQPVVSPPSSIPPPVGPTPLEPEPRPAQRSEQLSFEELTRLHDPPDPDPDLVLRHLARAGIYEPGGGAPPAWESAVPQKARGLWVLVVATLLLLLVGGSAYGYARHVKAQRAEQARQTVEEVAKLLRTGRLDDLRSTDDKLSRVFELDSRSPRAAELWLENRVLTALLTPGVARGIDSAVFRAKNLEVPEEKLAHGRIASFLVEGDVAGAAAILPKWDKRAGKDPLYQLAAGAALERAGDLRAIERYEAATRLDPKLVPARLLLARAVLLELGPKQAKPIVAKLKQQHPDMPAVLALEGLVWAVDPDRSEKPPEAAQLDAEAREQLPIPLRAVPLMVEAVQAIGAGESMKASETIEEGVELSTGPAMATRFGFLAIAAGNEKLARKAALRALRFAALYSGARVLAARVALLGGRLEEAKKAIEKLDADIAEAAVVHAVIAYEALDQSALDAAVAKLPERDDYAALRAAPQVLAGDERPEPEALEQMARPSVPWGELVSVDAALDTGNLELAAKLVEGWQNQDRPAYALRKARLLRYQNEAEPAAAASKAALAGGTTTARVLVERVLDLLAADDVEGARKVLAEYPALLGPMSGWLGAMTDAAAKRKDDAKVKLARLDLPPKGAPLPLKVLAAQALAAGKDKRAKKYVKALAKQQPDHPDVVAAKDAL